MIVISILLSIHLIYSHLITTAETAQKKTEQKKQKEKNRINNYGWNIFSDVLYSLYSLPQEARYRGYEKRLKNLPTNADNAKESEELYSDMLDFGMKSRLTEEQINRVVADQKKQDESNANFSKRRKLYNLLLMIHSAAIIKKKLITLMKEIVLLIENLAVTMIALLLIFVLIQREVLQCNLNCLF